MITKTARIISNSHVAMIQSKVVESYGTRPPWLTIMESGGLDDGAWCPAQSITIAQEDAIRALRDACNEALGEEVKPPTP